MNSSFENLSPELFYEICDYLDGYHIHRAFGNLNYYFQHLLNSTSLLLKFNYSSTQKRYSYESGVSNEWKQAIFHSGPQILSLCLGEHIYSDDDEFYWSFTKNSVLSRLESMTISCANYNPISIILPGLSYLPRLYNLEIDLYSTARNLTYLYKLIFNLSRLKSLKLRIKSDQRIDVLPLNIQQETTIEYLTLKHDCTWRHIPSLLKCTTKLRSLKIISQSDAIYYKLKRFQGCHCEHLTQLSLDTNATKFKYLSNLIQRLSPKLRQLSIYTISEDQTYLDAEKLEELILKYFLRLKSFSLKYKNYNYWPEGPDPAEVAFPYKVNQFVSPFWLDRRWIVDIELNSSFICFDIHPYKKRWYDEQILDLHQSTQLKLGDRKIDDDDDNSYIYLGLRYALKVATIYHLEINYKIGRSILCEILRLLPELISLKLSHFPSYPIRDTMIKHRKIEKLYILSSDRFDPVRTMFFFPELAQITLGYIDRIRIHDWLKPLLPIRYTNKNREHFISFFIVSGDDTVIEDLKKMMNESICSNKYEIKRVLDQFFIYL